MKDQIEGRQVRVSAEYLDKAMQILSREGKGTDFIQPDRPAGANNNEYQRGYRG